MIMLPLFKLSVLFQIVWDANAWREVNDDTLNIPGCIIPAYNVTYSKDRLPISPPCRRFIVVEKISPDRVRFTMIKQMDSCCYRFVRTKIKGQEQEKFTPCVPFKDQAETKLISDILIVKCDSDNVNIYEDTYFLVKPVVVAKNKTSVNNMWNVLILAIEPMSRAKAYSSLPHSIQFLLRNDWFDFRGYNTINNAMQAILTGKGSCSKDNCVPMWVRFQRAGYVTASNHDQMEFDIVEEKPTHYINPYSVADEMNCTRQNVERTLDYVLDFSTTYKKNFFGFFFFKRNIKDSSLASFITKLTISGVLYNTFVFIVGTGGNALSYENFYNDRLPMFFMWTPTTFRNIFKTNFSFLKVNQWRLVSPFDLHLTVLNVLGAQKRLTECPKCKSLFNKISEFRYCVDAGIDKVWCSCFNMISTNVKDYSVKYSLMRALNEVINKTQNLRTEMCTTCKQVTFKNLLRIHYYINETAIYYVIAFIINPDVAMEVSLKKYLVDEEFVYEIIYIEVLNKKDRGKCVVDKDSIYRSLCLCETNAKCFVTWFLTAELMRRNAKLKKFGAPVTESNTAKPLLDLALSGLSQDITAK